MLKKPANELMVNKISAWKRSMKMRPSTRLMVAKRRSRQTKKIDLSAPFTSLGKQTCLTIAVNRIRTILGHRPHVPETICAPLLRNKNRKISGPKVEIKRTLPTRRRRIRRRRFTSPLNANRVLKTWNSARFNQDLAMARRSELLLPPLAPIVRSPSLGLTYKEGSTINVRL